MTLTEARKIALRAGFRVQPNEDRTRWVVWRSIWNPVGSRETLEAAWRLAAVKAVAWKRHLVEENFRRMTTPWLHDHNVEFESRRSNLPRGLGFGPYIATEAEEEST